jgi:hypothetical protein
MSSAVKALLPPAKMTIQNPTRDAHLIERHKECNYMSKIWKLTDELDVS